MEVIPRNVQLLQRMRNVHIYTQYGNRVKKDEFQYYIKHLGIEGRLLPERLHNKNLFESEQRIIRDIYLRLKNDFDSQYETSRCLLVQQALRISNDLYGNGLNVS